MIGVEDEMKGPPRRKSDGTDLHVSETLTPQEIERE
jgi:hypothetical protein